MAFEFELLTAEERERYLALGRQYATPDVLAQASKSWRGYELYGQLLVMHGFGLEDGELLLELRDLLRATDGGHIQAVGDRKLLGKSYAVAKRETKDERMSARTLVSMSLSPLNKSPHHELAQRAALVLQQTSAVRGDKQLIDQAKTLHELLSAPELTPIIADRGGPQILERLQASRQLLLDIVQERAGKPEVPAAAERRDILDGAVVSLCRAARDASRVAARRNGQPAIAAAFKLDLLRSSRSSAPADPAPVDPTPDLPEPLPTP